MSDKTVCPSQTIFEKFDDDKLIEEKKQRIESIRSKVASYPDFPKPGILFQDLFSVLADPSTFRNLIAIMEEEIQNFCPCVDAIVGLDSRGFLLGAPLALALNKPFVPIRKKGKLPGKVCQINFKLEYGMDTFELQANSLKTGQKVVIVDDLLATGGSMKAASELVIKAGAQVALCLVAIELIQLQGRKMLTSQCHSMMTF